jgi:hypothetical protein
MADAVRDARVQARDDARAQAVELARVNAQLEAAQLEVARLQRAAEIPAPQPLQEGQGAVARPPQPFAFPQKVTYPELTKLTRKTLVVCDSTESTDSTLRPANNPFFFGVVTQTTIFG